MALLAVGGVADAAQQFLPHPVPKQVEQVLKKDEDSVWSVVALNGKKFGTVISSLFFQIIGFLSPHLSRNCESVGFFMLDLARRFGGILGIRQEENHVEDLQNEKRELAIRVDQLQQEKLDLTRQRDRAWGERNQAIEQRDQRIQERDLIQVDRDHLQRENARIVGERDFAKQEMDAAVQQRQLMAQENGHLERERALAVEQQELFRNQIQLLTQRRDEAIAARDAALGEKQQAVILKQEALEELERILPELQAVHDELSLVHIDQQRDQYLARIAAACDALLVDPGQDKTYLRQQLEGFLPLLQQHLGETLDMLNRAGQLIPPNHPSALPIQNLHRILLKEQDYLTKVSQAFYLHPQVQEPLQQEDAVQRIQRSLGVAAALLGGNGGNVDVRA